MLKFAEIVADPLRKSVAKQKDSLVNKFSLMNWYYQATKKANRRTSASNAAQRVSIPTSAEKRSFT